MRFSVQRVVVALILVGGLFGVLACDKPEAKSKGVAITTVTDDGGTEAEPVATQPASRPTTSTILIGEQAVAFPAARLVLQDKGTGVSLLLFSNDPPEAVHPNYKGNRFYFEIDLQIDDVAQLTNAAWTYKAPSMEREETPVGVFLDGDAKQLQPYDVSIVFDGKAPGNVIMNLAGPFTEFERRGAPPKTVWVRGMLTAELEMPKKK